MMLSPLPPQSTTPTATQATNTPNMKPNMKTDPSTSVLDTKKWQAESIVIVPPQPDYTFMNNDEFSYSHLYCYDSPYVSQACSSASSFDKDKSVGGSMTSAASATSATSATSAISATTTSSAGSATSANPSVNSSICHDQSTFDSSAFTAHTANTRANSRTNLREGADSNIGSHPNHHSHHGHNNHGESIYESNSLANPLTTRDPRKGAFTFSVNSEYDLLLHVQHTLDRVNRQRSGRHTVGHGAKVGHVGDFSDFSGHTPNTLSDSESAAIIMRAIDDYCTRKQWMYHIGSEKAVGVANFLTECVEDWMARHTAHAASTADGAITPPTKPRFVCVDLGTYCGYSALVLASTLRKLFASQPHYSQFEFHVYTTEISSKLLNVAKSIFRLSKLDSFITPILVDGKEGISDVLKREGVIPASGSVGSVGNPSSSGEGGIDFLLLDHAKTQYLPDLLHLESSHLLRAHSFVAADNVVFNRLDEYRTHMAEWARRGVAETSLEEMNLEYSNNLKDGIEMTRYLKDPQMPWNRQSTI